MGERKFLQAVEKDPSWEKLLDIPCPPEYEWIYYHFLELWRFCEHDMNGNAILTFRTLNDYVECMKVPFTVEEKRLILKMKEWAQATIEDVREKAREEEKKEGKR